MTMPGKSEIPPPLGTTTRGEGGRRAPVARGSARRHAAHGAGRCRRARPRRTVRRRPARPLTRAPPMVATAHSLYVLVTAAATAAAPPPAAQPPADSALPRARRLLAENKFD